MSAMRVVPRSMKRLRDDAWAVPFTNQNVTISAKQARRRGRNCRHRTRQPGRAAVDGPALLDRGHQQSAPAAPQERPASRLPC